MNKLISVLLFLVLLRSCVGKRTLPVFMMDQDNVMSRVVIRADPFKKITSEFFTELALDSVIRSECVVIFVEDTLCTEDLILKDNLGTPFYFMEKGIQDNKVVYMPAVTEPYELLRQIFEPQPFNVFHLGAGNTLKVLDTHKYIFVHFEGDSEMERVDRLRKHDMLMKEVYFTVRQVKHGPILAFYTGGSNPIVVEESNSLRVDWKDQKVETKGAVIETPEALFRLTGIHSLSKTRRSAMWAAPVVEYERRTRRTLSTTMLLDDFHMQFNFDLDEEKWTLVNVALLDAGEVVGRTALWAEAPWQRSYYCSEPFTIVNQRDGGAVTISEYQIEPLSEVRRIERFTDTFDPSDFLFRTSNSTNTTMNETLGRCYFSKAKNCGPYFNTYILSGLLVFFLFTAITFWGVIMIYNCGTNDRMEDPEERHLVIVPDYARLSTG